MQFLTFPLRLSERGLLGRQDQPAAIIDLLHVMARTPAGSWQGCPAFGLRDLFEGGGARVDVVRAATTRINEAFKDLGIDDYQVTDMFREPGRGSDGDVYSITLSGKTGAEILTTAVTYQQ